MVKCPNCGNDVKKGKFCGKCGTKVPENVGISDSKTCPKCGKSVSFGADFCPSCGHSFKEPKEEPKVENNTKKCPYCGATIGANVSVCPHCNNRKKFEQQNSNSNSSGRHKYKWLSAILSFFISGLGQLYNRQPKKAVILFVLFLVLGGWFGSIGAILSFIVRIYATYDGYVTAEKINSGEDVEDSFGLLK